MTTKEDVGDLKALADELTCDYTCTPCSSNTSCLDPAAYCSPCAIYAKIFSLAAGGRGVWGEEGEALPVRGKVTQGILSMAIDRLDKLLHEFYVGSREMSPQNYQEAMTAMEIIRAGCQRKGE